MPTVVDSLVMLFSLKSDDKGRKQAHKDQKDLRDDAAKTAKELERQGRQAAMFFTQLKKEAVGFFATVAGGAGLANFLSNMVNANAKLGLFAKDMNQNVSDIAMWQGAVERMGGSAEDVQGTVAGLTQALAMFQMTGDTSMLPWLRTLRINLSEDGTTIRNITDIFQEMHERLTTLFPTRDKAFAAGIGMGINANLLNVLLQTDKEFERSIKIQKERYITQQRDAEAALRLKQALNDISQSIRSRMTPVFTKFIDLLFEFSDWIGEHAQPISTFFVGLAATIGLMLVPAVLAFIAAWGPIVAIITAVSAVLGLLIEDWWTWLHGGKSALGDFWQFWADGWHGAVNKTADLFTWLGEHWDKILSGIKESIAFIKRFATHPIDTTQDVILKGARKMAEGIGALNKHAWNYYSGVFSEANDHSVDRPRGLRNNNPGNLNFAGQAGATLEGGKNPRFAHFATMAEGVDALGKQIEKYLSKGVDTISKFVNKYAPSSENDVTAYIKDLVGTMHRGKDEKLGESDVVALMRGVVLHEQGRAGADIAMGITQAPKEVASTKNGTVGAAAAAQAQKPAVQKTASNVGDINISRIDIITKATSAAGVADGLRDAISNKLLVLNAERGLS